jgi:molecular chaperone IbpA
MTNYTSLFPTSKFIGFDNLLQELSSISKEAIDYYPPFNILKKAESDYIIELALAGFTKEQLDIQVKEKTVIITGSTAAKDDTTNVEYLYKGISTKKFKRTFKLADYVEIGGATFKDGILSVYLYHVVPERLQPKSIKID